MKKQIIILLLALIIPCAAFAQGYTERQPAFGATAPSVSFRSTSGAMMSTGSTYSSAVFEIGSSSPSSAPAGSRPRKSGFSDITVDNDDAVTPSDDYDPSNPTLPLGDAILPLLLMALAYMVIRVRRKRQVADN